MAPDLQKLSVSIVKSDYIVGCEPLGPRCIPHDLLVQFAGLGWAGPVCQDDVSLAAQGQSDPSHGLRVRALARLNGLSDEFALIF